MGLSLMSISTSSFAYTISSMYWGKGPLKLSKNTADNLEYYFSSGKKGKWAKKQKQLWKPFFIVISLDGKYHFMYRNTHNNPDTSPHYVGRARQSCKKKSGQECFVFAQGYKILWDNGINKKRKLTKKEINAGKTLQILQELGFYGDSIAQTTEVEKKEPKKEKKKKKKESKKKEKKVAKKETKKKKKQVAKRPIFVLPLVALMEVNYLLYVQCLAKKLHHTGLFQLHLNNM